MSNKIKNISISGFRAFSEKTTLDFKTETGTADIVVIYAPNGTGKTSTIEGLEWAATGKISRIDDILKRAGARNGNPKEGYILKNRHYRGRTGSVSVQLDNGKTIRRNTKPKENRNNDYNEGKLIDFVDKMETFEHNILSQGAISKFSYEASNGNLFDTLIKNKSKENSEDIIVYDKINSAKNKVENAISSRRSEIDYINSVIIENEKLLAELKEKTINDDSLLESNDYIFFKNNFSLYEDLSRKNINESISYLNSLKSSIGTIKFKLLNFDISSYKKAFRSSLRSRKILELEERINKLKVKKDTLKSDASRVEVSRDSLLKYLTEINIKSLCSDVNHYYKIKNNILESERLIRKQKNTKNNVSHNISKLNTEDFIKKSADIETIRNILKEVFPNKEGNFSDAILVESDLIELNNRDITAKNIELDNLELNTFLKRPNNKDLYERLKSKKVLLDELNVQISGLVKEKESLISFDEKLTLIKSYVLEVVNEKELKDCPACGSNYENKGELIESVNSLKLNSQTLLDGSISSLNNQKQVILGEISSLTKEAQVLMSKIRTEISESISRIETNNRKIKHLFSLIRSLGKDFSEDIKLSDFFDRLSELEKYNLSKIRIVTKRKAKYERWKNNITSCLEIENIKLDENNSKLDVITSRYLSSFGEDVEVVAHKTKYLHVKMYKYQLYSKQLNNVNNELLEVSIDIEKLSMKLTNAKISLGSSNIDSYEEVIKENSLYTKNARSDFNFIMDNIKGFKIYKTSQMIDFLSRLENLIASFLSGAVTLQEISNKEKVISENRSELERVGEELSKENLKLAKIERALTGTMEYFSMLASQSINNDILNDMFMYVEPHLKYDKISFKVDLHKKSKGIYIQAGSSTTNESNTPIYYLSEAQINILSICIFLAEHARGIDMPINTIIIDDPVQSMDDLNSYALIDLCKVFARRFKKQIIITTHNNSFFNLFRSKLPEGRYSVKYIKL